MKPSGTIYNSSQSGVSGELRIALTEKEKKHFKLMRFISANISSLTLAFMLFFYGPSFEMDLNYQAGLAKVNASSTPALPAPAIDEFVVYIPAIGAAANVIPDIDPFDENVYEAALKRGVAHAANTAKPGEVGRVYLFAHSTNSPTNFSEYNAVFYQLRLLNAGDRIFVNFNGETYLYTVRQKIVVDADDTHWLSRTSSEEELVLQTCDPPGTTLRRLLIIAKRSS